MYFIKKKILRFIFKLLRYKPTDMPMVRYWKTKSSIQAKIMRAADGSTIMRMEGEKEVFPGFPRGYLLFGSLSKIKHEIKTRLYNDNWWKLEANVPGETIIEDFKKTLVEILNVSREIAKYDMIPYSRMPKCTREIWRAMTVIENKTQDKEIIRGLKEIITYVLTEDDAYRFRLQWIIQIFNPSKWWLFGDPIKNFDLALEELENAEVVNDMKDRVRLFRRITMLILEDTKIKNLFIELCKEMNWNKLKLSKADKYHFRGKYFKVDWLYFEY